MASTQSAMPPPSNPSSTTNTTNLQLQPQPPPSSSQATSRIPTPLIDTAPLSRNLTAPTSPTSPHAAEDAARAMSSTGAWQPRLDRRQSWDSQEYKHVMQAQSVLGKPETDGRGKMEEGGKEVVLGGFTEGR